MRPRLSDAPHGGVVGCSVVALFSAFEMGRQWNIWWPLLTGGPLLVFLMVVTVVKHRRASAPGGRRPGDGEGLPVGRWRPGDRFRFVGSEAELVGPAEGDPDRHFREGYRNVRVWGARWVGFGGVPAPERARSGSFRVTVEFLDHATARVEVVGDGEGRGNPSG